MAETTRRRARARLGGVERPRGRSVRHVVIDTDFWRRLPPRDSNTNGRSRLPHAVGRQARTSSHAQGSPDRRDCRRDVGRGRDLTSGASCPAETITGSTASSVVTSRPRCAAFACSTERPRSRTRRKTVFHPAQVWRISALTQLTVQVPGQSRNRLSAAAAATCVSNGRFDCRA